MKVQRKFQLLRFKYTRLSTDKNVESLHWTDTKFAWAFALNVMLMLMLRWTLLSCSSFFSSFTGSGRNFNDYCWMGNAVGHKWFHGFLECTSDNFLAQRLGRTTRRNNLLLHICCQRCDSHCQPWLDWPWSHKWSWEECGKTIAQWSSRRMCFGLLREMVGSAKKARQRLRNFMLLIPRSG